METDQLISSLPELGEDLLLLQLLELLEYADLAPAPLLADLAEVVRALERYADKDVAVVEVIMVLKVEEEDVLVINNIVVALRALNRALALPGAHPNLNRTDMAPVSFRAARAGWLSCASRAS